MKIAFRVDSSALIGGGHVMRCLTLADELRARGAETSFVAAAISTGLAERVRAGGHALHMIAPPNGLERSGEDWERDPLAAEAQIGDARRTIETIGKTADWIIVDHYLLDADWHREARQGARRLMVIDDLANRPLDCDLLLDQTLGRIAGDYSPFVSAEANMLLGSSYALLRPEFARERPAALARRRGAAPVRRILLSLGTTDIGGITGSVLQAILPVTADQAIDVVLGANAPSLPQVLILAQANPRVAIHVDAANMAELMRDADFAIGAAGTTSWERCCLGLPSLTLTLATNQSSVAKALHSAGASRSVDLETHAATLAEIIDDEIARARMIAAAFAIVDGVGAGRVAEQLTGKVGSRVQSGISLRPAVSSDSEQLWLWRNDPLMRAMAKNPRPIAWNEHVQWFAGALANPAQKFLIAECSGAVEAMVRFDIAGKEALVSINVNPSSRGKGIGGLVLNMACSRFSAEEPRVELVADIRPSNRPSETIFTSAGFVSTGLGDTEFHRLVRAPGGHPLQDRRERG